MLINLRRKMFIINFIYNDLLIMIFLEKKNDFLIDVFLKRKKNIYRGNKSFISNKIMNNYEIEIKKKKIICYLEKYNFIIYISKKNFININIYEENAYFYIILYKKYLYYIKKIDLEISFLLIQKNIIIKEFYTFKFLNEFKILFYNNNNAIFLSNKTCWFYFKNKIAYLNKKTIRLYFKKQNYKIIVLNIKLYKYGFISKIFFFSINNFLYITIINENFKKTFKEKIFLKNNKEINCFIIIENYNEIFEYFLEYIIFFCFDNKNLIISNYNFFKFEFVFISSNISK